MQQKTQKLNLELLIKKNSNYNQQNIKKYTIIKKLYGKIYKFY